MSRNNSITDPYILQWREIINYITPLLINIPLFNATAITLNEVIPKLTGSITYFCQVLTEKENQSLKEKDLSSDKDLESNRSNRPKSQLVIRDISKDSDQKLDSEPPHITQPYDSVFGEYIRILPASNTQTTPIKSSVTLSAITPISLNKEEPPTSIGKSFSQSLPQRPVEKVNTAEHLKHLRSVVDNAAQASKIQKDQFIKSVIAKFRTLLEDDPSNIQDDLTRQLDCIFHELQKEIHILRNKTVDPIPALKALAINLSPYLKEKIEKMSANEVVQIINENFQSNGKIYSFISKCCRKCGEYIDPKVSFYELFERSNEIIIPALESVNLMKNTIIDTCGILNPTNQNNLTYKEMEIESLCQELIQYTINGCFLYNIVIL